MCNFCNSGCGLLNLFRNSNNSCNCGCNHGSCGCNGFFNAYGTNNGNELNVICATNCGVYDAYYANQYGLTNSRSCGCNSCNGGWGNFNNRSCGCNSCNGGWGNFNNRSCGCNSCNGGSGNYNNRSCGCNSWSSYNG